MSLTQTSERKLKKTSTVEKTQQCGWESEKHGEKKKLRKEIGLLKEYIEEMVDSDIKNCI